MSVPRFECIRIRTEPVLIRLLLGQFMGALKTTIFKDSLISVQSVLFGKLGCIYSKGLSVELQE